MAMSLDEWFEQMWIKVNNIERMLLMMTGEDAGDYTTEEQEARDVGQVIQAKIGEPRPVGRYEMVKTGDNTEDKVAWADLGDRVKQAIKVSKDMGQPYQLYYGADGRVMISVSQQVAQALEAR